jgi:hypothetical protein
LRDGNQDVVDLTGATITFSMKAPGATSAKVDNAAATVIGAATDGQVRYTFEGTDTDTIGPYMAEFKVNFSGGLPERFPNGGWLKVLVLDAI